MYNKYVKLPEKKDSLNITVITGEKKYGRFLAVLAPYGEGIVTALHGIGMTLGVTRGCDYSGHGHRSDHGAGKIIEIQNRALAASVYVEIIRGTPLFVQVLILAYGVPYLVSTISDGTVRFNWQPLYLVGILACGFNSGAYLAEIIRSGIQAVGQRPD